MIFWTFKIINLSLLFQDHLGNGHVGNGHVLPISRNDLKGSESNETAAMLEVVRIQEPAVHKK
jgi:hypothetical protein